MSGSNDPQLQALLLQMRGQQRRPSAQSRLAEQMMASLNNPAPVYSTGAGLARVGSGILAGLMGGMAERDERQREEQQLRDLQERTDAREAQQTQRIGAILAGAGFGNMLGAAQAPPQASQMAPQAPMPMDAVAGAAATEAALPPGQSRFNPSTARNVVDEDGRDWDPALRGRPWDAGLRPPTGRVMPLNPEAVPPPRPGVLLPGMAGAGPQTMPHQAPPAGRNYEAAALALAMTPGGERLAPIISQMGQRADRTFPTVEINGPQGPGTYERTPQGLRFLGPRMPPQEAPDEIERLIRQAGMQPGSPEAQAAARDILNRRGMPTQINNNVDTRQAPGETRFDQERGKTLAEEERAVVASMDTAGQTLRRLDQIDQAAQRFTTGVLSGARITAGQVAAQFGIPDEALRGLGISRDQVASGETIRSLQAQMLQGMIGPGGFPAANFSNADREMLERSLPGLQNSPQGNAAISAILRASSQRSMDIARSWNEYSRQNGASYQSFDRWTRDVRPTIQSRDILAPILEGFAQQQQPAPVPARAPGLVDRARQRNMQQGVPALPPGFEVVQ